MEKKKLLLVAISVGIFLVITIGAGILFFTANNTAPSEAAANRPASSGGQSITVAPPSYQPPPGAAAPSASAVTPSAAGATPPAAGAAQAQSGGPGADPLAAGEAPGSESSSAGTQNPQGSRPAPVDAVDIVRSSDVPGLQSPPEGVSRQDDFYVSGAGKNGETRITVARPTTAAVPTARPAGRAAPSAAPAKTPSPSPAKTAPRASAPASQARPAAPQTKVYDDFWVQTGAFSTIAKAEGVKESLTSQGITSIIENRQVNGKTLFRVRVGPYTSQNEANYWLSLIKSIDGFEDSQVRQTQSRR